MIRGTHGTTRSVSVLAPRGGVAMTNKSRPTANGGSGAAPEPPKRFREFVRRYPELARAWEAINEAGDVGPLDARTRRLVKIAVAIGAMREGAVRAGVRKGTALGLSRAELEQLVPLAAGTIGLPSAVACWSWMLSALDDD
jgi:4-carboxymuconolactone decarboxylase